jgi:xylan 1,4-beta-xylosidase
VLLTSSCGIGSHKQTEEVFLNPIMAGYYPDPSICRVDNDYYMVNSSFAYFPGIPLFHSKDLVNWRQIGHVLDRPEQLQLEGLGISRGIFAPAIRYHKGTFYVVSTQVEGNGNFVVTTNDIEGSWSNPVWLPDVVGIDPSLFFDDDGKAYIMFNSDAPNDEPIYEGHRAIWLYEFDYQNLATVGERKLLVDGGVDITQEPIWIEAPHIIKKDGYYYLTCAEGGTGYNHSQVVFRSKRPDGDFIAFEGNPILTQRHLDRNRPNPITSTGHADFVELPCGQWWAVFLGCRPYAPTAEDYYNLGRETFLTPLEWIDGWPIINPHFDEVLYAYPLPNLTPHNISEFPHSGAFSIRDEFDSQSLMPYWVFVRTVTDNWYTLSNPEGKLTLKLRGQTLAGYSNPSFVARRQQHNFFEASASMVFNPASPNEIAGLAAFQGEQNHYVLGVTTTVNGLAIQLLKPKGNNTEEMAVMAQQVIDSPLEANDIMLRIVGRGSKYDFYYALNSSNWIALKTDVDGTFLSTRIAGGFVGTTIGMYATSNGKDSENVAHFNWFEYSGDDPVYKQLGIVK